MSDSETLSSFADRVIGPAARLEPEADPLDDLGCFGWLRGIRDRAAMLELRKKTGTILAIGYGWLERAAFDPSDGITLHLPAHKILIRGKNLNAELRPMLRLFEGIAKHRVAWVRESSRADRIAATDSPCVIESIEWERP
ncbi:MAG: hypothetical protein ACKVXR_04800 [Planctomycetota bacterium]